VIKTLLKGTALLMAVVMATLFFLYVTRRDPYTLIPGKQVTGEEVAGHIDDWSFTLQHRRVINEVRPSNPYSVNTSSLLVDDVLYIPSGGGGESRWAQFLVDDPTMRLKVGDKIYPVMATLVEEPEEVERVRQAYQTKYPNTPADRIARFWFFRVESG